MTECKNALDRLIDYLDNELTEEDSEELCRHLELCRQCYDRVEFEKALKERIRLKAHTAKAPEALTARIKGLLDQICPESEKGDAAP